MNGTLPAAEGQDAEWTNYMGAYAPSQPRHAADSPIRPAPDFGSQRRAVACRDSPVVAISRRLGFAESTNFSKFFTRETGQTPGTFRNAQVKVADQSTG